MESGEGVAPAGNPCGVGATQPTSGLYYYHTPRDTAERLDYGRMARVVEGLKAVIEKLAGSN